MRKWMAVLLAVSLLLAAGCQTDEAEDTDGTAVSTTATGGETSGSATTTTTAQSLSDGKYDQAVAAIAEGEYGKAYELLYETTDERAPALRSKLVYMATYEAGDGQVGSFTYDAAGYLIGASYVSSLPTDVTYTHDGHGNLLTQFSQEKSSTNYWSQDEYTYENGLVTRIVSTNLYGPNNVTSYTYNGNGQPVSKTYECSYEPDCHTATYTYDAAGRLTAVESVHKNGTVSRTTYAYDANGNKAEVAESINTGYYRCWTYTYDAAGRLLTTTESGVTSGTTTYAYDADGNLLSRAYECNDYTSVLTYAYDRLGRRTGVFIENDGEAVGQHTIEYGENSDTCTYVDIGTVTTYRLYYFPDGVPSYQQPYARDMNEKPQPHA